MEAIQTAIMSAPKKKTFKKIAKKKNTKPNPNMYRVRVICFVCFLSRLLYIYYMAPTVYTVLSSYSILYIVDSS